MNLRRSSIDSIQIDELEEDQSPEDKLEEATLPSVWAPHLRGLKPTNRREDTGITLPVLTDEF